MKISISLQKALAEVFTFKDGVRGRYNNDMSGLFFMCKEIGGSWIVPAVTEKGLSSAVISHSDCDIAIPILKSGYTQIKKTGDSVITLLFYDIARSFSTCNYCTVKTDKGYKYIGGKGYILTDKYEPIIICGYEVKRGEVPTYNKMVCVISPKVFSSEDLVSKCIVKKVIPFYTKTNIYPVESTYYRTLNNNKVRIIISEEIESLISKPAKPNSLDINEHIYNVLDANKNNITI